MHESAFKKIYLLNNLVCLQQSYCTLSLPYKKINSKTLKSDSGPFSVSELSLNAMQAFLVEPADGRVSLFPAMGDTGGRISLQLQVIPVLLDPVLIGVSADLAALLCDKPVGCRQVSFWWEGTAWGGALPQTPAFPRVSRVWARRMPCLSRQAVIS